MKRTLRRTLALISAAIFALTLSTSAEAAKKKPKTSKTTKVTKETKVESTTEEPPPPPPPPEEAPPPPPPPQESTALPSDRAGGGSSHATSNHPADFGTGYSSWGTRGGATLGTGSGARAQINFGYGGFFSGYGYAGAEGQYIFNLGQDFDLGVGARLPFYPFGLAPGATARYRFIGGGAFQLALDASLYLPMTFVPFGFTLGMSIEPGVMMSYFVKDNMEIFFGLILPISPVFVPGVFFNMGFDLRAGFAYTFKRNNIGIFANFDIVPGFGSFAFGGVTAVGTAFYFGFNFSAGAQFRF